MIRSMTAFSRQTSQSELGVLTLELKSVNHRFSEVSFRLPEDLRPLEAKIRDKIAKVVQRGKVDCNLRYQAPDMQKGVNLDTVLVASLSEASQQVSAMLEAPAAVNPIDIMKWPGVIQTPEIDSKALQQCVMEVLDSALQELLESRQREGGKIKTMIEDRCTTIEAQVSLVQQRLPVALEAMRTRLRDRLDELQAELDQTRVEQEMVFLLNKSDVAEEMDRLAAHVEEVRHILQSDKPIGRRLDFLMQELNREANTLGSKSIDQEITKSSVELKVLIEQMREQIQNVE